MEGECPPSFLGDEGALGETSMRVLGIFVLGSLDFGTRYFSWSLPYRYDDGTWIPSQPF